RRRPSRTCRRCGVDRCRRFLFHEFRIRRQHERAGPGDGPTGAAAAAPSRPTRSRRALAAADVADFWRAIMRPPRRARWRYGVCFASTPIATALTLTYVFARVLN